MKTDTNICPKSVRGQHQWPAETAFGPDGEKYKVCRLCGARKKVTA
jgi:hypothetical protein